MYLHRKAFRELFRFLLWVAVVLVLFVVSSCVQKQVVKSPAPAEMLERGSQLYRVNCQTCHGGDTGGAMTDIPPPHNANGHTWHHPDCQLVSTVLNGSGEMGDMMRQMMGVPASVPRMPAFKGVLSEEDVRVILAYVKTWWTEEQRRSQARLTEGSCS